MLARQNQKERMNPMLVIITYIYLSMLILNEILYHIKQHHNKKFMSVYPISNMLSDRIFSKHRFTS